MFSNDMCLWPVGELCRKEKAPSFTSFACCKLCLQPPVFAGEYVAPLKSVEVWDN